MADKKSLLIKIDGDSSSLQKEFGRLKAQTQQLQDNLSSIAKKSAVAFAGLTATVVGLTKSYRTQEQAQIRTKQTLQATGSAAGLTAEELFNMASELQKVTTFGDEAILSGQNLLLTFRNIGKDTFPRATEAILDMSTAMGTGLKESAIQLGKALNDPITGISSLTRVGITFTEQQKEQIKAYQDAGQLAKAQSIILKELEMQFGGVSRAAAEGTGVFIQLSNSIGDIFEKIGKNLSATLSPFAKKIKEIADRINESNPIVFEFASNILLGITAITGIIAVLSTLGVAVLVTKAAVVALGLSFSATWAAATLGLTLLIPAVIAGVNALGGFDVVLTSVQAGFTTFGNFAERSMNNINIAIKEATAKLLEFGAASLEVLPGSKFAEKAQGFRDMADIIKIESDALLEKNTQLQKSYGEIFNEISAEKAADQVRAAEEAMSAEREAARELELERREEQDEADAGYREQKRQQIYEETQAALAAQRELEVLELSLLQAERMRFNSAEILTLKKKITEQKKIRDKGRSKEKIAELKYQEELRNAQIKDQASKMDATKAFLQWNLDATVRAGKTLFGESSAIAKALFGVQQAAAFATSIVNTAKGVTIALGSAPPPLNFALAAAVGAAGALQSAAIASTAIQGFNSGGIVGSPMGGTNQDRYPAMLADGELVVPRKNFNEVVNATAQSRSGDESLGGPSLAKVEISFTDEAAEFITARQLENATLGTDRV